jgi:hypothetical protein
MHPPFAPNTHCFSSPTKHKEAYWWFQKHRNSTQKNLESPQTRREKKKKKETHQEEKNTKEEGGKKTHKQKHKGKKKEEKKTQNKRSRRRRKKPNACNERVSEKVQKTKANILYRDKPIRIKNNASRNFQASQQTPKKPASEVQKHSKPAPRSANPKSGSFTSKSVHNSYNKQSRDIGFF